MLANEFIGKVVIAFKGKPANKAPQPGSAKYEMYLSVANDILDDWARMSDYNWKTLRQDFSGVVDGNVVTMPDNYLRVTDSYITVDYRRFDYLNYEDRHNNGIYEYGDSPTVLKISNTDQYDGKTLKCGIITLPPKLEGPDSEVICDSIPWLIYETAAQIAKNDPSKSDLFPDLAGIAGVKFKTMARASRYRPKGSTRFVKNRSTRIRRYDD